MAGEGWRGFGTAFVVIGAIVLAAGVLAWGGGFASQNVNQGRGFSKEKDEQDAARLAIPYGMVATALGALLTFAGIVLRSVARSQWEQDIKADLGAEHGHHRPGAH